MVQLCCLRQAYNTNLFHCVKSNLLIACDFHCYVTQAASTTKVVRDKVVPFKVTLTVHVNTSRWLLQIWEFDWLSHHGLFVNS